MDLLLEPFYLVEIDSKVLRDKKAQVIVKEHEPNLDNTDLVEKTRQNHPDYFKSILLLCSV